MENQWNLNCGNIRDLMIGSGYILQLIKHHDIAWHYNQVTMTAMASQIISISISAVCSAVGSDADQRKHQSSASLAFQRGIHRWPVNSSHQRPVTRKMFPFDDVIMETMQISVGLTEQWFNQDQYLCILIVKNALKWQLQRNGNLVHGYLY